MRPRCPETDTRGAERVRECGRDFPGSYRVKHGSCRKVSTSKNTGGPSSTRGSTPRTSEEISPCPLRGRARGMSAHRWLSRKIFSRVRRPGAPRRGKCARGFGSSRSRAASRSLRVSRASCQRKKSGPGLRGVVQLVEENPAGGFRREKEPYPGTAQAASTGSSFTLNQGLPRPSLRSRGRGVGLLVLGQQAVPRALMADEETRRLLPRWFGCRLSGISRD